jgi:hypothetical protein
MQRRWRGDSQGDYDGRPIPADAFEQKFLSTRAAAKDDARLLEAVA